MSDDDVPLDELADRLGLNDEGEAGADETELADRTDDAEPQSDEEEPLGALAERVRARREDEAVSAEESPFESMDVSEIDSEAVWEELFGDEETESHIGVGGAAERVDGAAGTAEYVVEKATFCKRCPFLGDPPELHCTNDGTEILEVVDTEHFRVRECPMVDEEPDELTNF